MLYYRASNAAKSVQAQKTWKSNTLQPEMENWEKENSKQNSKSVGLWEKPMIEEQPSWTHKELTAERALKNGTEQPQVCKNFPKQRKKAKGFVSNE